MANRIAVVVSQGQSRNPAKRQLEEDLVTTLLFEPGLDVTVVPNLYDLSQDGTGMLALQGIKGPMIVVSWLYPRAAHWVLDRNDIRGLEGATLLKLESEDEDDDELEDELEDDKVRVNDQREIPDRRIYCVDFRASESVDDFVDEIKRIAREATAKLVQLGDWPPAESSPSPEALARFETPTNDTALALDGGQLQHAESPNGNGNGAKPEAAEPNRVDESPARRWYPVIDYSSCTNCMECIDFCLFGVYGVDATETILVELPDNCRKGCPACSRVCPENAIIFPQHKTPTIAGAPSAAGGLKIDLSLLFGKQDALEEAASERDEQLMLAGREAVGMSVGIPKRQADASERPNDELDDLLDELDDLDL